MAVGAARSGTFLLCLFLRTMPSLELVLAAFVVSAGVVLSIKE
jgi:hypothetical protein